MSKESRPSSHENNNLLNKATSAVIGLFEKDEKFEFVCVDGDLLRNRAWREISNEYPKCDKEILELKDILTNDSENKSKINNPETKTVVEIFFGCVDDPLANTLLTAILCRRLLQGKKENIYELVIEGSQMLKEMKMNDLGDKQLKSITRKKVVSLVLGKNLKLNSTPYQPQIKK